MQMAGSSGFIFLSLATGNWHLPASLAARLVPLVNSGQWAVSDTGSRHFWAVSRSEGSRLAPWGSLTLWTHTIQIEKYAFGGSTTEISGKYFTTAGKSE